MLGWVAGRFVGWCLVGSVCVDDCWAGRLLRGWFADRLAAVAGCMVGLAVESAVDSPWIPPMCSQPSQKSAPENSSENRRGFGVFLWHPLHISSKISVLEIAAYSLFFQGIFYGVNPRPS